jgi:integrase/recombinase XerD
MLTQVDRFLHFLEEEQDRSANTTAAYRNDLTQFTRFVTEQCGPDANARSEPLARGRAAPGVHSWQEVDEGMMQTYLLHLRECDYASATVARKVAAIKSFFHWLQASGGLCSNPADGLEAPKVKKVMPRPISPQEIERLLAEPGREQTPQALRDKALMETLYASGMRVTEVVGLDLSDVDLEQGMIHCGGQGKKSRSIPLYQTEANGTRRAPDSPALRALRAYLENGRPHLQMAPDEQALFLNHRGQRLTRQGLWLILKRYVRQVGIEAPVTPHTLRQSFAAHQINSGVDLQQVRDLLGHASTQTTQAYRRAADELAGSSGQLIIDGKIVTG